jgi:UDP-N-acetylglucosamine 4,6-dehydratase
LVHVLADEHTVRAMDINEAGLAALKDNGVRLILGDINDRERLDFALDGCDVCIHTASYKNLDITEYNVESTFGTNIFGTLNVARACMAAGVKSAFLVSSDKAVDPTSAYGVSKLAQERIWLWATRVCHGCDFMIGRFGNFSGKSSGSCFEVWDRQKELGEKITVTDVKASRYFIPIEDVVSFIIRTLKFGKNGRIYIPKMKEERIYPLAMKWTGCKPNDDILITGLREGEKVHEELYSRYELTRIKDRGDYYELL